MARGPRLATLLGGYELRISVLVIIISLAALAAAGGCAKSAEEVIVVTECDCDEPCPDCVCEKEGKAGGAPGTAETAACAEESGP